MGREEEKSILKQSKLKITIGKEVSISQGGDKKTAAVLDKKDQLPVDEKKTEDKKTIEKQTNKQQTISNLKPPTVNDNPKIKKSRIKRTNEKKPAGKIIKINEMFKKIESNTAQP